MINKDQFLNHISFWRKLIKSGPVKTIHRGLDFSISSISWTGADHYLNRCLDIVNSAGGNLKQAIEKLKEINQIFEANGLTYINYNSERTFNSQQHAQPIVILVDVADIYVGTIAYEVMTNSFKLVTEAECRRALEENDIDYFITYEQL